MKQRKLLRNRKTLFLIKKKRLFFKFILVIINDPNFKTIPFGRQKFTINRICEAKGSSLTQIIQ